MTPRVLLYAWLSAICAGLTAVLAKAGLSGTNADLATLVRTAFVLAFLAILYLLMHGVPRLGILGPRTWMFLAGSALAAGLSWIFFFRALQSGPVAAVSAIDKTSLVFAALAASAFLGERLTIRTLCGAIVVVAGVVLMTVKSR